MIISPLLTSSRENEFDICNEIVSYTVRRNLIILQNHPQTLAITLNTEHFCMGLGLSANPEMGEGACTGLTTGLLMCGVVPVKVDGHFAMVNVVLLFLLSETRGIIWVAISGFLFLRVLYRLPQITFLYKASCNNGNKCHCLDQSCCLLQNRIWPLCSYLFFSMAMKMDAQLTQY